MQFSNQLNQYIETIGCTAKELSVASGLSQSLISNYRSGSRLPAIDSERLGALIDGLVVLGEQKSGEAWDKERITAELCATLQQKHFPYERFQSRLNALMGGLSVSSMQLSRYLNFDASYISRVRNGRRNPTEPELFASQVSEYVVSHFTSEEHQKTIAQLMNCLDYAQQTKQTQQQWLMAWLTESDTKSGEGSKDERGVEVNRFLKKLDEFDLDAYIISIHFDTLKVPTVPFCLPVTKYYYGVERMCVGELDFLRATALSPSKEKVFMCSDMQMADMSAVKGFPEKWMFGLAAILKKGLHLNMIHTIDRPFHELMLGLEAWIPLYMTGQVSPYYLKKNTNSVYGHLTYVSGAAALEGECITGYHSDGRYYFTNHVTELEYYRRRANALLEQALPLMQIVRAEEQEELDRLLTADAEKAGDYKSIRSTLPIYTLEPEHLRCMLQRHSVEAAEQERVLRYTAQQRRLFEARLKNGVVQDFVLEPEQISGERLPALLDLSGCTVNCNLAYTDEEYRAHWEQTQRIAAQKESYQLYSERRKGFRNLQIITKLGKWVLISKSKSPTIHFFIRHPKLIEAIEQLELPV